ncbi:MAG: hypothetical protein II868_01075, partial [Butyrivibrio sp.]|nr:hypothetical protein [Butyrivibrio sp.]
VEAVSYDRNAFQGATIQALLNNLDNCQIVQAQPDAEGDDAQPAAEITVFHAGTGEVIDRAYLNREGKVTR